MAWASSWATVWWPLGCVVGVVPVADYDAGHVRVHEFTRPDKELDRVRHVFTHFELEIEPLLVELDRNTPLVEGAAETWYKSRAPTRLGLAAPVRTLVAGLAAAARAGRR